MTEKEKGFTRGLIVGVVAMIIAWIVTADVAECRKVSTGYLTYENKTYTVTLYDELRIPGEEED